MEVREIEFPMRFGNVEWGHSVLIPSPPGWRLVVIGPDGDHEACPIVAWGRHEYSLVPFARVHGQDGHCSIVCWAGNYDVVVGLLAPGEEFDAGWQEACDRHAEALREAYDASEGHS